MHLFASIGASLHTLKSAGLNRKYISYYLHIFRMSSFATGMGSVNQFEEGNRKFCNKFRTLNTTPVPEKFRKKIFMNSWIF